MAHERSAPQGVVYKQAGVGAGSSHPPGSCAASTRRRGARGGHPHGDYPAPCYWFKRVLILPRKQAADRNNRGVSTNRIDEEKEEVAPEAILSDCADCASDRSEC